MGGAFYLHRLLRLAASLVMLPAMPRKPRIAIVGPGNLGGALALALRCAGYRSNEIIFRETGGSKQRAQNLARRVGGRAVPLVKATLDADITWLCVPDSDIAATSRSLARREDIVWKDKLVFHSSGALPAQELAALLRKGAVVASVHPLMTFVASDRESTQELSGVPFAIEGDARAVRVARGIVRDLGGDAFAIRAKDKPLYHAWGAFVSPLVVALLAVAEQVGAAAVMGRGTAGRNSARKKIMPILHRTLRNYVERGPAASFSGPLVRGDVATVRLNLRALATVPGAKEVYLALARSALRTLPVRNRAALQQLLSAK